MVDAVVEAPSAPPSAREITVKRFCEGVVYPDAIKQAFMTIEHRDHGVRKMTQEQWATMFEGFLSAERR